MERSNRIPCEYRICRLQYAGKSETALNLHLNNLRDHIKRGVGSCKLTEYFHHNYGNTVTFTSIEQIKRSGIAIERK